MLRSLTVDRKPWTGAVGRPLINLKWKSNKGFYILGSVVNRLVFGDQETGLESEETGSTELIQGKDDENPVKVKAVEMGRMGHIQSCVTSGSVELVNIWFEG